MIVSESIREYHAKCSLSKTKLWRIIEKGPEWFKYCEEHPEDDADSPSLTFGGALHKAVLEPGGFSDEYAVMPNIDRRTREGREAYVEFLAGSDGKTVITAADYEVIAAMAEKLAANRYAKFLLSGEVEKSYYWTDETTGLSCQARPDSFRIINGRGVITDLKTCTNAGNDAFRRDAVKYGYDMQAAMFKTACEKEHGVPCDFIFVAIEKTPPYMINVTQADELLIKYGEDRFREALGTYKECRESGNWFGYNGSLGIINNLSLPAYIAKEIE